MAYGLIVRNGQGKIVIDDESIAIQKIRDGVLTHTGTIGAGPTTDASQVFSINRSNRNSMLFMQPKLGQYVTPPIHRGISSTTGQPLWAILSNWTDDIPFFECAPAPDIIRPKAGWGLEIRAPNGDIRFHSGAELLAIDDHYVFDKRSVNTGYYDRGWYSEQVVGSNAWICPGWGGGSYQEYISNSPPSRRNIFVSWGVARLSGNRISIKPLVSRPNTFSDSSAYSHVITNMSCFTAS